MRACAVPVSGHRLRVERRDDAEVLGDAVQDEASHPQVISHLDALARPDLELPLKQAAERRVTFRFRGNLHSFFGLELFQKPNKILIQSVSQLSGS